jgi:hypothetical protein
VGACRGVLLRQPEPFGYCIYGSGVAWQCCVLLRMPQACIVGLCSLLMDQLGGYSVVHPASQICLTGTWSSAPPNRLARRGLRSSCLTHLLGGETWSGKWDEERLMGLALGTPFLSTRRCTHHINHIS